MNTIMDNKIRFISNNFNRLLVKMDEEGIDEIYNNLLDVINEEYMDKLRPKEERSLVATFEHLLHDGTNCNVVVSCVAGDEEYNFGSEDIQVFPECPDGFESEPLEFDVLSDEDKDTLGQACLFALMEVSETEEEVTQ